MSCRAQTCALMAEMGVGVNEAMLRPVSAANVYVRACANLVNQQYRQGTISDHLPYPKPQGVPGQPAVPPGYRLGPLSKPYVQAGCRAT